MRVKYNVIGDRRKEPVKVVADTTGARAKYLGMPSAACEIDCFTVTKDGTLEFDDRTDTEETEQVLEAVCAAGFACEKPQHDAITIEMPKDYYTDESLVNLRRLIRSKEGLIKKAVGAKELPIVETGEKVLFPWFTDMEPEALHAYAVLIHKLSKTAKEAKRVTAMEKKSDNEKYAFRCFLLRLGFIGEEYKADRKALLKNLSGSSAFKTGGKSNEISD